MSAISELKRAKEHSDKRQYGVKHQIIKKMMTDDPDAFYIDSDDGKGIVGVTHKKTGFRFHMPTGKVKSGLSKEAGLGELLKLVKPYAKATKDVMLGTKLPPMTEALKEVPEEVGELRHLVPNIGDLLRFSFGRATKSAAWDNEDSALAGGAAVGAGGALKLHKDINNVVNTGRSWDAAMQAAARTWTPEKLQNMSLDDLAIVGQNITDAYSAGGQRAAQAPLLGVSSGHIPKLRVHYDHLLAVRDIKRRSGSAAELSQAVKSRDARLHHYNLFTNKTLGAEDLRGHMISKALEAMEPGLVEKLPKPVSTLLTTGNDSISQRLKALDRLPNLDRAFDVSKVKTMLHHALAGSGGDHVAGLGELNRLSGARGLAMNTPQVYQAASRSALNLLRGGRGAMVGLGAGSLGLLGMRKINQQQTTKQAASDNAEQNVRDAAALGLLGASPLAVYGGTQELRRKDLNRIGITYGVQDYDGAHIGGGHKEPSTALRKILEDENIRRKSGYKFDSYVRNSEGVLGMMKGDGKIDTNQSRILRDPGVNVMVNTGFGDYTPRASAADRVFTSEGLLQNTPLNGRVRALTLANYLTDAVPEDWDAFGATAGDSNPHGRTVFYGWGDSLKGSKLRRARNMRAMTSSSIGGKMKTKTRLVPGFLNATGVGPLMSALGMSSSYTPVRHMGSSLPFAISEDKLQMLESLRKPGAPEAALREYVAAADTPEDAKKEIQKLLDAKASGKKVVTFSGATRGDYVAHRAGELAEHLKSTGGEAPHILAQVGKAMGRPEELSLLDKHRGGGMSVVGPMKQKAFIAAQALADVHNNSTGTSSWAEARLVGNNNAQPKEWGMHTTYPDHKNIFIDDYEKLKQPTIASRMRNTLQDKFPGLPEFFGQAGVGGWNRGQLQDQIKKRMMIADTPSEIMSLLNSGAKNSQNLAGLSTDIRSAHKNFAKSIFREAAMNKFRSRGKGLLGVIGGLAAVPAAWGLHTQADKKHGER